MIFCDGTYLNTQYMDEADPNRIKGITVYYNYNSEYSTDDEPSTVNINTTDEPDKKRHRRNTFRKIKYFESKYIDFEKYTAEMSEEVMNSTNIIKNGSNTSKKDAICQIKWLLIF